MFSATRGDGHGSADAIHSDQSKSPPADKGLSTIDVQGTAERRPESPTAEGVKQQQQKRQLPQRLQQRDQLQQMPPTQLQNYSYHQQMPLVDQKHYNQHQENPRSDKKHYIQQQQMLPSDQKHYIQQQQMPPSDQKHYIQQQRMPPSERKHYFQQQQLSPSDQKQCIQYQQMVLTDPQHNSQNQDLLLQEENQPGQPPLEGQVFNQHLQPSSLTEQQDLQVDYQRCPNGEASPEDNRTEIIHLPPTEGAPGSSDPNASSEASRNRRGRDDTATQINDQNIEGLEGAVEVSMYSLQWRFYSVCLD